MGPGGRAAPPVGDDPSREREVPATVFHACTAAAALSPRMPPTGLALIGAGTWCAGALDHAGVDDRAVLATFEKARAFNAKTGDFVFNAIRIRDICEPINIVACKSDIKRASLTACASSQILTLGRLLTLT